MSLESVLSELNLNHTDIASIVSRSHFSLTEDTLKYHLRQAREVYGCTKKLLGQLILKFPQFAGLDHARVVREAVQMYGHEERVKEAVLKFPQFASYDHARVVREAVQVYGHEEKVKEAVLKFPQFASLDHARVVREAVQVYGHEERVKEAVLKFPQFAGLDHARVVRQRTRLGRLVGLSNIGVITGILQNPVLAGYSAKRYLAGIDISREFVRQGHNPETIRTLYFTYISLSPYIPHTNKKRISQVTNYAEPPLMTALKKRLEKE